MLHKLLVAIAAGIALASATPGPAHAKRVVDDNDTVTLRGNVHPLAKPEFEVGLADPALPMERMVLSLRMRPEKLAELEQFLAAQQDPSSPDFQRWLTPDEFKTRFAPPQEDVDAVTSWLTSHGFTIEETSRGGTSINFSGNVSKVERALHTKIRDYVVDGKLRHANSDDPAIPRGLADVVAGVVSLHNFPHKAMNAGMKPLPQGTPGPQYTDDPNNNVHYLAPADFATIYNVSRLYSANIDGTGQVIAIVGRTHPSTANWSTFRSTFGLPANPPVVVVNGPDPGDLGAGEDGEADLDVEWAGAVAKKATIKFVTSKSTYTTDGVDLSAQYIVNNNLAPVMSTSFGLCEQYMTSGGNTFYNNLWQQAAAQGITSFVSSGDSGAAGCSPANDPTGSGLGVNGLSSTPYNVSVGGTQFDDSAGGYWNATNGSGLGSAIGYIPERAWNESGNLSNPPGLWSTGGGASVIYAKPSWQVAPGVPADGKRDTPDVSLTAAGHDGYFVASQGTWYIMSGTSASSPALAGIMALVVQKTGQRQGNANTRLYQLANSQYAGGGPAVFHDTTFGNNTVPGVTGYSSAAGYDLATGLGSVDAYALATNWNLPPAPLAIGGSGTLSNGTVGAVYNSTLTATGGTPPYTWSIAGGSMAAGLSLNATTGQISGTPTKTGVFSFSVQVADSAGGSVLKSFTHAVSATACGNWPVLAGDATQIYYPDFPSAYPSVANNDPIRLQALDFSSDFVFDRDVSVKLTGGYDCGYTANAATTGLLGKLRLTRGAVKIEKLRLK